MADYGADQWRWEHGILKGHEGHDCQWDGSGEEPCPDDEHEEPRPFVPDNRGDHFERRRMRVYIAGPISKGDVWENIIDGIRWGRRMLRDGMAPMVPHLDAYLTLNPGTPPTDSPSEWNALLEWDLEWVAVSDALFRIPGESTGADLEAKVARRLGIPVFEGTAEDYGVSLSTEDVAERVYARLVAHAFTRNLLGKREYNG